MPKIGRFVANQHLDKKIFKLKIQLLLQTQKIEIIFKIGKHLIFQETRAKVVL